MTLADPAASRAVLIGVAEYRDLANLPAVAGNVRALESLLTDPETWGLPAGNCVVAAPGGILDAVTEAAEAAVDTLVVYYAGHGMVSRSGELYLGLPGTLPGRPETALRFKDLSARLGTRAAHTVVILDCCYSGRAAGVMSAGGKADATPTPDVRVPGSYLLTASSRTQRAMSPPDAPYSTFTGGLIDVLTRGVPGGPEVLDMEDVYRHLPRSRPKPRRRTTDGGSTAAFVKNRSTEPAPPKPWWRRRTALAVAATIGAAAITAAGVVVTESGGVDVPAVHGLRAVAAPIPYPAGTDPGRLLDAMVIGDSAYFLSGPAQRDLTVTAIDLPTSTLRWRADVPAHPEATALRLRTVHGGPAVVGTSVDSMNTVSIVKVSALDPVSGEAMWSVATVPGTEAGTLVGYDRWGEERWRHEMPPAEEVFVAWDAGLMLVAASALPGLDLRTGEVGHRLPDALDLRDMALDEQGIVWTLAREDTVYRLTAHDVSLGEPLGEVELIAPDWSFTASIGSCGRMACVRFHAPEGSDAAGSIVAEWRDGGIEAVMVDVSGYVWNAWRFGSDTLVLRSGVELIEAGPDGVVQYPADWDYLPVDDDEAINAPYPHHEPWEKVPELAMTTAPVTWLHVPSGTSVHLGEVTTYTSLGRAYGLCAWTPVHLTCPTADGFQVWRYRA
ncbi:caspase, EACC1-associated type [Phytomonospora endophytica]|uniref:Peptidase C14 caspase domain-containing protein n=1 Tax=Phytomonospora endophytica TaxID=714109 RepID=A0A841FH15_9ACTN|nr:caspase family protein [Phytomonospora endophytica]MBB6035506.1 hypothetical protein [Phytomonospora endophytica]GIG63741.1 hypothetical protein Pen01_00360 [Phytomonospora endophytica]